MRYLAIFLILMFLECCCSKENSSGKGSCICEELLNRTLVITCDFLEEAEICECFLKHNQSQTLDFRNSRLRDIPFQISFLRKIVNVDFSYNEITELDFARLNLSYTCSRIENLNLDFNNIHVLKNGSLDCFSNLRILSIQNNSLKIIEANAFNKKVGNFRFLYAQNNDLVTFDSSIFSMLKQNSHISANVSFNKIANFTNSANLTIDDINPATSVGILLMHNNFTRLNLTYLLQTFHIFNRTKLLNLWNCAFDLRFNPLICDCEMYPMARIIKLLHKIDPNNPFFSLTCNSPHILHGKTIFSVDDKDFNCTVKERCPSGCLCTETISMGLLTVSCGTLYSETILPVHIPTSTVVYMEIQNSALEILQTRAYLEYVTSLDVSKNKITTIDSQIIPQLDFMETVYLHENALEYLPEEMTALTFANLSVLTLNGNPFKCDCHSLWLKRWLLKHTEHIPNQDKILCFTGSSNKPVVKTNDSDFICSGSLTKGEVVAIVFGIAFLLFAIMLMIRAKWVHIQVLLIAHFNIRWFRKKIRTDLEYDIFVSHSSHDDDIVYNEIIPRLENNDPPFAICRYDRDFSLGQTIAFNIISKIESSLTTLLVVSNNFLRSDWCRMEFKQAHMNLLTQTRSNLLMIILEDLDPSLMDKEIKNYVNTHVYLKISDKYFWPKLLQALPVKQHIEGITKLKPAKEGRKLFGRRRQLDDNTERTLLI